MFLGGWFWMDVDGFGCLQIILCGFKWLSIIYSFTSYGEIRCFKFKSSRQLWRFFLISSNKTLRFSYNKWPSFCVIQQINFHLKWPYVGEKFWKLTYIALCKFFPIWFPFSPFWANFFKDFVQGFGSLLVGRSVF